MRFNQAGILLLALPHGNVPKQTKSRSLRDEKQKSKAADKTGHRPAVALLAAVGLSLATLPAPGQLQQAAQLQQTAQLPAQMQQAATVSMHATKNNLPVVAVKLNGVGPYDFLVDTGATVTVVDPALFAELGLKADGAMKITTAAGATTYSRSRVKEIAVDGLAVADVKVIGMNAVSGVRGILGENFLQHFDLLIDNQHRKITLDASGKLAESFDGERLPITFTEPTGGGAVRSRPMVSVKVPAYSSRPVKLLLDSGVDQVTLTGQGTMQPETPGNARLVKTVNGPMSCTSGEDKLDWGKTTMHGVTLVTCPSSVTSALEEDGLLPTAIFRQIFISHAGSYAIVNPAKRKAGLQEVAAADPLIADVLR